MTKKTTSGRQAWEYRRREVLRHRRLLLAQRQLIVRVERMNLQGMIRGERQLVVRVERMNVEGMNAYNRVSLSQRGPRRSDALSSQMLRRSRQADRVSSQPHQQQQQHQIRDLRVLLVRLDDGDRGALLTPVVGDGGDGERVVRVASPARVPPPAERANRQGVRLSCCKNGAVVVPGLRCPAEFRRLLTTDTPRHRLFLDNIRAANSLFAMASFKTSAPGRRVEGQGRWSFSICGQIYHFTVGVPATQELRAPVLSHYYYVDIDEVMQRRNQFLEGRVDPDTIRMIEEVLRRDNRYIGAYMTMGEVLREERDRPDGAGRAVENVIIGFRRQGDVNVRNRQYDLPESRSNIAAIFYGIDPPYQLDLTLYPRVAGVDEQGEQVLRRHELKNLNPLSDPLVYPLLFPFGEDGYYPGMRHDIWYSQELPLRDRISKEGASTRAHRRNLPRRDTISTPADVDAIVSAEIPDPETQPRLYDLVARYQIHRPCGTMNPDAPCMTDGRCRKYFPRAYCEETILNAGDNHRPLYRRPRNGRFIQLPIAIVTNTRVVPYNPYALVKFQTHINFEVVGSLKTMKYLYKYVSKGPDCITAVAEPDGAEGGGGARVRVDEVADYLDSRYVSSMEAAWRLQELKMHDRSHSVMVLPVHLPGNRMVVFDVNDDADRLEDRLDRISKLEAWFILNRDDVNARRILYSDIPEHYTWDNREGWRPRRQVSKLVGCIADVSPRQGQMELFFLRVLLRHVAGPTSYEDLRTVDGRVYPTFKEACDARHLLTALDEYDRCMREAVGFRFPGQLRRLFVTIIHILDDDRLAEVVHLWRTYKDFLIEDFVDNQGMTRRQAIVRCLELMRAMLARVRPEITLEMLGIVLTDDDRDDVPVVVGGAVDAEGNLLPPVIVDDVDGDGEIGAVVRQRNVYDPASLNVDQKRIFMTILRCIAMDRNIDLPVDLYMMGDDLTVEELVGVRRHLLEENVFFVDGLGGSGKTYLYNTLLFYINNVIRLPTIAVAWTGVAANLLIGGKTCHRAFRLPVSLDELVVVVARFRQATAACQHEDCCGGVRHGTIRGIRSEAYAEWLLALGEGRLPYTSFEGRLRLPNDLIEIPRIFHSPSLEHLLDYVYGGVFDGNEVGDRAILCPTNATVDELNSLILDRLGTEVTSYFSVDSVKEDPGDRLRIPMDLLNSVNVSGLPPHELKLKVGAVVMLLRNLDVDVGECNGARMKVTRLGDLIVECEFLTARGGRKYTRNVVYHSLLEDDVAAAIRRAAPPRVVIARGDIVDVADAMEAFGVQGEGDELLEQIDVSQIVRQQGGIIPLDDEQRAELLLYRESDGLLLPDRSEAELRARVSTVERPGTSGLGIPSIPPRTRYWVLPHDGDRLPGVSCIFDVG
ncbi:hypothetical protein NQ314_012188 [Rhamnusium bicolor]|uniref:ATP-dependent DNA helicase n=1 Tax=Rhamnusium bicolor TaxID=1586634 RepID=A0AAV8XD76_9CUCU|nr:hypothetical protein NQ314_012188 [Rhamnusium bicolor]